MQYLNGFDYAIIVIYFLALIAMGMYLRKMASASLEDYFLGGRRLPWWALGVSGMASFLDVAGTMVIVSFLFMLGPRGLYIAFRGGAVLLLVFMLLWTGKWHRRSGCMTTAEWMMYRFGTGAGGHFARIVCAASVMVGTVGMLAYMVKGVGLFLAMFLPLPPFTCSLVMLGVATLYTMASGFYGVVFTDIIQSVIILAAVIIISTMAVIQVGNCEDLAGLAQQVTGNSQWTSAIPHRFTAMPKGYEVYQHLAMFAFFYMLRNIFTGMGTGGDQRYFAARNDRECGMLTFFWTWLMMVRWPMMMGFAVLGLFLVNRLIPDQTVLAQSAELIRLHLGDIDPSRWADTLAEIIHSPQQHPEELIAGLKSLLGADDWTMKLKLLSYHGTVNAERILPAVMMIEIPIGLRGLLLVALIAASMSTFDTTINTSAAYFTKDIYQQYLRPTAANRELLGATYVFSILIVTMGYVMGYWTKSINDIWVWITMGFGAGIAVPGVLRLYWWRFNGSGFAVGMAAGLIGAIVQRVYFPLWSDWQQFTVLTTVALVGAIVGTYLTPPTDRKVLEHFYRTTRPFGLWGPLRKVLPADVRAATTREHRNDLMALPFAMGWQITLFLLPMLLIVRAFTAACVAGLIFAGCLVGMYVLWYSKLPPATDVHPHGAEEGQC